MSALRDDKFEHIVSIVRQRQSHDHDRIKDMVAIRERYEGDWVVPVPDVEGSEDLPAPVPHLLADAIDQTGMRAASVMPYIDVPMVTSTEGRSADTSRQYASIRRRAHYARWDYSALDLLLQRAARQLIGYGSCALGVIPDFDGKRSRIVARDPLTAYPEPRDPEDVRPPENAAFVYGKSREWLAKQYPEARETLDRYRSPSGDDVWDVFEWVDADETIIGILGPRRPDFHRAGLAGREPVLHVPLRRWPNRAGMATFYIPERVSLSRVMSQVAKMLPLDDLWAKMMALDVVAAEKAIFTDKYAFGADGRTPAIVSGDGTWKDGRTGEINLLENVSQIGVLSDGPGAAAQPVIDRLERATRIGAGASPQFHGENPGSLRTGRAVDAMTSFTVDPRIQEVHTILKYALRSINEMGMAVDEGYWPNRKIVAFSGWNADPGTVTYTPSKHFETKDGGRANAVNYAIAGADLQETTVGVGQLVGAGLMSTKTGATIHPMITDAEIEERQRDYERLKDAVSVGFSQQTAAGQMLLATAAEVAQQVRNGEDILDAIVAAEEEARQRQQEQQQAMQEAAAGGGPGGPEGAGGPPAGPGGLQPASDAEQAQAAATEASQQLSAVPPTTNSQERLRQLFASLRARA